MKKLVYYIRLLYILFDSHILLCLATDNMISNKESNFCIVKDNVQQEIKSSLVQKFNNLPNQMQILVMITNTLMHKYIYS